MYAVIRSGGKQYTVRQGDRLKVERLEGEAGSTVEFADVLMLADGDAISIGAPTVAGARVVTEIVDHGKGAKLIIFKYKPKIRYRKRTGHRQHYTQLTVREIIAP